GGSISHRPLHARLHSWRLRSWRQWRRGLAGHRRLRARLRRRAGGRLQFCLGAGGALGPLFRLMGVAHADRLATLIALVSGNILALVAEEKARLLVANARIPIAIGHG